MTEAFVTYSKRSVLYYTLLLLFAVPGFICVISKAGFFEMSDKIFIGTSLFAITIYICYIFLKTSILKMYQINGELIISDSFIQINSTQVEAKSINKIIIDAGNYKGNHRGTGDGSGNKLKIFEKNGNMHEVKFVINSEDQRDILLRIMGKLNKSGINVLGSGF